MGFRVLFAVISVIATLMFSATSSALQAPFTPTLVSNAHEQSFMALADRHFRLLAGSQDYVTASNIRWDVQSTKADPPVPLPVLYAHFSCIDANKDGRISAEEYREFARAAFRSASVSQQRPKHRSESPRWSEACQISKCARDMRPLALSHFETTRVACRQCPGFALQTFDASRSIHSAAVLSSGRGFCFANWR